MTFAIKSFFIIIGISSFFDDFDLFDSDGILMGNVECYVENSSKN